MTNRNPQRIEVTKEFYEKSQQKLKKLEKEREEVLVRLQTAREMGDLSENGAYKAARWELGGIDRELRRLNYLLRMARVTEKTEGDRVSFGSKVTIKNKDREITFTLVSGYESDPKQQKLSVESPIGKAVKNKKVGEIITVETPGGNQEFTVVVVE